MHLYLTRRTLTSRTMQYGGTFLGLILGVLIGLFAALAVAVYVTKVPIPFSSKNNQVEGSVQAEIEKNKIEKNKDLSDVPASLITKIQKTGDRQSQPPFPVP